MDDTLYNKIRDSHVVVYCYWFLLGTGIPFKIKLCRLSDIRSIHGIDNTITVYVILFVSPLGSNLYDPNPSTTLKSTPQSASGKCLLLTNHFRFPRSVRLLYWPPSRNVCLLWRSRFRAITLTRTIQTPCSSFDTYLVLLTPLHHQLLTSLHYSLVTVLPGSETPSAVGDFPRLVSSLYWVSSEIFIKTGDSTVIHLRVPIFVRLVNPPMVSLGSSSATTEKVDGS